MARSWLIIVFLVAGASGCIDRHRVNERCAWTPADSGALDLTTRPNQMHLYADVELVEELAIRYADEIHRERFGSYGHGGLIDNGRLRDSCMATLVAAIATAHHLTSEQVEHARARGYRDWRWDAGVLASFAGVYGILVWIGTGALSRRFPAEEGWETLLVVLLASLPASLLGLQLFALWGGVLEALRIGNGHLSSYRSAKSPWPGHWLATLIGGIIVFLLVAAIRYRNGPRQPLTAPVPRE